MSECAGMCGAMHRIVAAFAAARADGVEPQLMAGSMFKDSMLEGNPVRINASYKAGEWRVTQVNAYRVLASGYVK